MSIMTRVCLRCKVERPLDDFYLMTEARRAARLGHSTPAKRPCRICARDEQRQYRVPRQEIVDEAKRASGCMDCGLHPEILEILEFDHRPDGVKSFNISAKMARGSLEDLRAEISKCDIVCANCHRIRTVSRRGTEDDRTTAGMTYNLHKSMAKDLAAGRAHVWEEGSLPAHVPKVVPGQEALFAA